MDCLQDLEFHDDGGRALEKAKESILLMKKKMLRSHELILQYNNKLKECERLKGDLCVAQEDATKFKRENSVNLSKVVKLEMQSANLKKYQQELEQKIAECNIQIASDKSHRQQLECKLKSIEENHEEKLMEAQLHRSSLEVKVKELEQELKASKKSHLTEVNKFERALKSPKEKKGKKVIEVAKEMREIGVNTAEQIQQPKPLKPATVDKSVLTNEFYHIKNNPYPLFCSRCESLMVPNVEKICRIMTHPPLVSNMLSPVRPRVTERQRPNHNESNYLDSNGVNTSSNDLYRSDSTRREISINDTSRTEPNLKEYNGIDPHPQNFLSPLPSQLTTISNSVQEIRASPVDAIVPEVENLRRTVETLKKKLKKRRTQKSSDSQPQSSNYCGHSHPPNCCGHSATPVNSVPSAFPNMQVDLMTQFFDRMMNVVNDRDHQQKSTKLNSRRKERTLRDKRARTKLLKLKKMKLLRKSKNHGSSNWAVDSSDCDGEKDAEKRVDPSDPTKPHLLRIKPSRVDDARDTLFSDAESEQLSPTKYPSGGTFANPSSPENPEKSPKKANRIESDFEDESPTKVPENPKTNPRGRKRGRPSLFGDDAEREKVVECARNEIIKGTQRKLAKSSASNTRTRSKSLRVEKSTVEQRNATISSGHSEINESGSISSDGYTRDLESSIMSRNSTDSFARSAFVASDADHSDVAPEIDSDSEPLESTNLLDRVEQRKRKRQSSPRPTKRTGKFNLLGKLRALKKNSVNTIVAKTSSSSSTIHATRSLSRRTLTAQSESEDFEGATKEDNNNRASSVSTDEASHCLPVKKQRIAHVPKRAASPQSDQRELPASPKISRLTEVSDENSKNTNERPTVGDRAVPAIKRPLTRRLAVEKLEQIKSKNDQQQTKKNVGIRRVGLQAGVAVPARRGRPPTKRLAAEAAQQLLNSRTKEIALADSTEKSAENHQVNPEEAAESSVLPKIGAAESSVLPKIRAADPSNVPKNSEESSQQDIRVEDNSAKPPEIQEKEQMSTSVAAQLAQAAEDSILELDRAERSLTPLHLYADTPIEKTGVVRALPAAKSVLLDASSSASPAASLASFDAPPTSPAAALHGVSAKPPDVSIPPSQSAVSSSENAIGDNQSKENSTDARNSALIDGLDASSASTEYSVDKQRLASSADAPDGFDENTDAVNGSKASMIGELANETDPTVPDESPASPEATTSSPLIKNTEMLISRPAKPEERLSIYDKAALPSIPQEEAQHSRSLNTFNALAAKATIFNDFSIEDDSNDRPIEKPIARNLLVYDVDFQENFEDECEDLGSRNIVNPQFFVETSSVAAKKNDTRKSGDSFEPINVKELRSRQVLCSPTKFENHQNLQKTQIPMTLNDEARSVISSDAFASNSGSHSQIRNIGTLLGRHLNEQKKKCLNKYAKLRKAAAAKVQETAEKNVKAELEKLIESDEWTSELHQTVVKKLLDVRSARTVAKSIVDFLIERASLDEPLDRTYTPPAPVMTRTQQRIVTLIYCLERQDTVSRFLDLVQAGIEFAVFRLNSDLTIDVSEYLVRISTVILRVRKDRERVRILCCDAFYCLGRKAIPVVHVILTTWPEVLPKHGSSDSELPNCLAHMIKMEHLGSDPLPKLFALKKLITNYYEYPQTQPLSAVVMTVLMKALHERYSNDLETAILLVSKREGTEWALTNVIEKGLMKIIQDDGYQWQFEALRLLGFILRTFPVIDTDKTVQKFVELLCQKLDSGEGSEDKQEGLISALLSLCRFRTLFLRITDSVLKWRPARELRASTLEQLDNFFSSRTPHWWNMRRQSKIKGA